LLITSGSSGVHSSVFNACFEDRAGTRTLALMLRILKWSSAWPLKNSWRKVCPTFGCAGMKMPGRAPFTPVFHEPSVSVSRPLASSFRVDSPR